MRELGVKTHLDFKAFLLIDKTVMLYFDNMYLFLEGKDVSQCIKFRYYFKIVLQYFPFYRTQAPLLGMLLSKSITNLLLFRVAEVVRGHGGPR